MNRSGQYITQPSGYKAFIPSDLPPILELDEELLRELAEADIALGRLDTMGNLIPNLEHVIAMYVRKEALLSSQIEGTQASLDDLFDYESDMPIKNVDDVKEVVNYIKALDHGIQRLADFPMSIRLIKEIHAILLNGVRGENLTPGEFRRTQNWIGAPGSTLANASFVPPPPREAVDAMGLLELFLHKNNHLPILVVCALIHYQFETIHPFLDGNGRLGRLLITYYLHWKNVVKKPSLYLSYYFKVNRQEYYDRLSLVRNKGDYEQWIRFFLKGVVWTAHSVLDSMGKILALKERHKQMLILQKVSSPLAIALLDLLFEKPELSITDVSKRFEMTYHTAKALIADFAKLDIVREKTGKKRGKRYIYWEYLDSLAEGTEI